MITKVYRLLFEYWNGSVMRIRDPARFLKQLEVLQDWGGAVSYVPIPEEFKDVEPELHDMCHAVVADISLPPPYGETLESHVDREIKMKYGRGRPRDDNELRTLAVEVYVFRALGLDEEYIDEFLNEIASKIKIRDLQSRVKHRAVRKPVPEYARKVIRSVRYHSESWRKPWNSRSAQSY